MRLFSRGSVLLVVAVLTAAGAAGAAPDMKLKDLMKKVNTATASDDAKGLAPLFTQAKGMTPAGADFAGMNALYDKAIAASNAGDLAAAKATCKECHTQFRDKYKTKHGSKAP